MPSVLIPLSSNSNSTGAQKIQVQVSPNTKVAYWAARPGSKWSIKDPLPPVTDAYGKFDNSGVVMSDASGIAIISFEKGTEYSVPSGRQLKSHVLSGEYGMIGPVQTVFV